ncbi:hypothetical protein AAC387_Pa08g2522 [Persea americana]
MCPHRAHAFHARTKAPVYIPLSRWRISVVLKDAPKTSRSLSHSQVRDGDLQRDESIPSSSFSRKSCI